jgi:hypothetical protein
VNENEIDIDTLKREYMFASNPEYIYDTYRVNNTIITLTKNMDAKDIIKEYESIIQKEKKSIDDVVMAYSMLIAITFLDFPDAKKYMDSIDLSKLEWGEKIKEIYMRNAKSTSFKIINGKGIILVPHKMEPATSNNTKIIRI